MTDTSDLFVRSARALLKMTQVELGALLGVNRSTVARYESGETLPEATKLALLHLLTEHGIDAETRHACLHLPNRGRHRVTYGARKMRKRISTYKSILRKSKEERVT